MPANLVTNHGYDKKKYMWFQVSSRTISINNTYKSRVVLFPHYYLVTLSPNSTNHSITTILYNILRNTNHFSLIHNHIKVDLRVRVILNNNKIKITPP